MPEIVAKRRGGNVRNARTTHPYRQGRRQRAADRSESYANRSVEDQLRLIVQRPGQSAREVYRLTAGETSTASVALEMLRSG